MCLSILNAIIERVTSLICCPFICKQETNKDVQAEGIKQDNGGGNAGVEQTRLKDVHKIIIIPELRAFEGSREAMESAETSCEKKELTGNPTSYDNGRFAKLADQLLAMTTGINDDLKSYEKTELQTVLETALSRIRSNGSLLISNGLEKPIPVSRINIDSPKLISQIPEPILPKLLVTNSTTSSANCMTNTESDNTDRIEMPATQAWFMQDMDQKRHQDYMQSTIIGTQKINKNSPLNRFKSPKLKKRNRSTIVGKILTIFLSQRHKSGLNNVEHGAV